MISNLAADLLTEALRVFILGSLPLVGAVAVVGTIIAIVQASMAFQEGALQYAAKLLAAAAVLYAVVPALGRALSELLVRALT